MQGVTLNTIHNYLLIDNNSADNYAVISFRRGKLNSQFIVTARMDFQISQNFSDFRCYQARS